MAAYGEDPETVPQNTDPTDSSEVTDPDWKPGAGKPDEPSGGQDQGGRSEQQPGRWTGNESQWTGVGRQPDRQQTDAAENEGK